MTTRDDYNHLINLIKQQEQSIVTAILIRAELMEQAREKAAELRREWQPVAENEQVEKYVVSAATL